ncbi:MAG: hypothetical protein K5770_02880 [Lachnospiraceae bacterium]|nr:hypothetical protein [Lachnospiraceae bacterium]
MNKRYVSVIKTETAGDIKPDEKKGRAYEYGRDLNKTTHRLVIIIIILLLALIFAALCMIFGRKPVTVTENRGSIVLDDQATDEKRVNAMDELSDRYVVFAGMSGETIDRKSTVILENVGENERIYMKFIITDKLSGEVYKETDLIPAGQHMEWIPGEKLEKGEYELYFCQKPYYLIGEDDYMELTVGNNLVKYTIV